MKRKVYLIGPQLEAQAATQLHRAAIESLDLPIEVHSIEIDPAQFHEQMTAILGEPEFLGAKILEPYKQTSIAYCQEITPSARGLGAVNTIVRRPSGLIYGENTDVLAFVDYLREQGIDRVRTALVLGAGGGARVALAGLRNMNCARYMVGFGHPRRPAEIASQFKDIRRQISFFQLDDMKNFFSWINEVDFFADRSPLPPPTYKKTRRRDGSGADTVKRWDLLVNATPVGDNGTTGESLITITNFLRCFERVLDLVPSEEPTQLVNLARTAGVPATHGDMLHRMQEESAREMWLREYRRSINGEVDEPRRPSSRTAAPRRKPLLRKRNG
jgi:shikimate dehydrogenase